MIAVGSILMAESRPPIKKGTCHCPFLSSLLQVQRLFFLPLTIRFCAWLPAMIIIIITKIHDIVFVGTSEVRKHHYSPTTPGSNQQRNRPYLTHLVLNYPHLSPTPSTLLPSPSIATTSPAFVDPLCRYLLCHRKMFNIWIVLLKLIFRCIGIKLFLI